MFRKGTRIRLFGSEPEELDRLFAIIAASSKVLAREIVAGGVENETALPRFSFPATFGQVGVGLEPPKPFIVLREWRPSVAALARAVGTGRLPSPDDIGVLIC